MPKSIGLVPLLVGRGLLLGGILLGGLALLWGFFLIGIYTVLAAVGDASIFLLVPIVAFGAGAIAIAGGVVGRNRLEFGSGLILVAGTAGLVAPAPALLLNRTPFTTLSDILIAYVAVAWWAIAMVWLGAGVLVWRARRAALKETAARP